jgi:DUF4097 and DUF4098 domain-containing protein YvlB
MRLRDVVTSTVLVCILGVILAAAPGRSQLVRPAQPVAPEPPTMPKMVMATTTLLREPPKPLAPATPARPATPTAPRMPASPAISAMPAIPAVPASPEAPSAETNEWGHSGSRRHEGPAADCSDLHIEFRNERAVVESEERALAKAEVGTLRVSELENGGVQLQGWDNDSYSVTMCKAADPSRDAKQLLSEIKLSVQGGQVSVSRPSRHEQDWTVFLLIRTPRQANVELKAHNGPVSLYGVDGKITARGANGPISIDDFKGEADIAVVNGPISFSGTGGKLRLHADNGPISVALNSSSWNGAGLIADAINGPLTLRVPSGFQSSFLLESNGHSPMSCRASVCNDARKTWDDEHRRIEYGTGTPLIRLSTENGPVSVDTL